MTELKVSKKHFFVMQVGNEREMFLHVTHMTGQQQVRHFRGSKRSSPGFVYGMAFIER